MAGLDFKSHESTEQEDESVVKYNTRLGLKLFTVYTLFYAGFMWLSAFSHKTMGTPVFAGLNLSIVYGFALIFSAIILSLIYLKIAKKSSGGKQ